MKILYLNNSVHLGGDTKCILQLSKEFKNMGNEVFVASNGGIMENEFKKNGICHFNIGDVEDKSPINILFIAKQIRRILKKYQIDIIHSHHRMTTLIAKLSAKGLKTRIIHTQHLCIEDKFFLTNLALRNINIVSVSKEAKKILVEKSNIKEEKITTIYNAIDTSTKSNKVDETLISLKKDGYFIVGQVSRIIDYKGIYDFVDIAEKVISQNENIRFVFIGDGRERKKMQDYIEKKGLKDKVFLLGSKSNVIDHLKFLDLFILCSYVEGLPLTPIEAFSQKIPVIGTNIGGTNEEIKDGVNGYLINKKDIDRFKEKIIYLYDNKDKLSELGNEAYNTYLYNFNMEKYIQEHKRVYKGI